MFSSFNPGAFVENLGFMATGMISIFAVIGIIILVTVLLNAIFSKKNKKK